jgi:DUF4097 and DUF4098 domain-containing protein YvlB
MLRLAIVLAVLVANAGPAAAQRKINERFAADPAGFVRIQNIAGSVKVMGWDSDSIAISGVVYDTPAERFEIYREAGGVKMGIWDTSVEKALPSTLEIRVPRRSRVWVRTGSSFIFVGGVTGTVDVNSIRGGIEVAGQPREVYAESMSGEVFLDDVRSSVARLKTITGAIRIRGMITDAIATSTGGNIVIDGARIDRGRFESVDGDLRLIGDLMPKAMLDFVNHAGAVEFLLTPSVNADFAVTTYEGRLENDFQVKQRQANSKIKGSEMTFTLGTGGAQVNVRTFKGRIFVRPGLGK